MKSFLLGFTILSLQINVLYGCFEEERSALLDFKASVQAIEGDTAGLLLRSWSNETSSGDCCKWERVTCNSTTGHVIMLFLNETRPNYDDMSGWSLNISIFHHFMELRSLDLSLNAIAEFIGNEDSKSYKLNKLENLDLSWNYLDNQVLKVLGQFKALKSLYLQNNVISGSLSDQGLSALSNLKILNLHFNELNGTLPIQFLANFKSLEILDLSWNEFTGSIPSNIGRLLPSLKVLTLSRNFLNGNLPTPGLCQLQKLKELDLSLNSFRGAIPPCLGKLTQLNALNLSRNHLTGSVLKTLSNLSRVESLDLSYNSLSGEIPQELTVLHFLKFFSVAYNKLSGRIPDIKRRFGKFDKSSYEGNSLLCGVPLNKSCKRFS
ncbi:receptor like protein 21-like [Mercurialis annua]|uniref:receptor like protein 21-like n=1 Tax=Mercurialis annua TaxID=3986 RepID=UPI002160665D|nr:receptor like protein 21-like [Mercurialis annua]